MKDYTALYKKENWEYNTTKKEVYVYDKVYPMAHPASIHLDLYRNALSGTLRYEHMKRAHDYIWPQQVKYWHRWTQERFEAHCHGYQNISLAGGAGCSKSFDAAKIGDMFYLANPTEHAVIVMSTTMESVQSRVYGYCVRHLLDSAIKFPFKLLQGQQPCVVYKSSIDDKLHTIKAVAAKAGDSMEKIKNIIGRHPKKGLLLILDEGTDLPIELLDARQNLETCPFFQTFCLGNSNSKHDMHGVFSTPKGGWASVDPKIHSRWDTIQKNGICLYANCFDSPAIHEPDPAKKKLLGTILITQEKLDDYIKTYTKDSPSFYRFVMGFWAPENMADSVVISQRLIDEAHANAASEFNGLTAVQYVAGLDAGFSVTGDKCVLQLAAVGTDTMGNYILDFRRDALRFYITLSTTSKDPAEIQIAKQVIAILTKFNCPLNRLAIDSSGQGRALAGVIQLQARSAMTPLKIFSVRHGVPRLANNFDCYVKTPYMLWSELYEQICAHTIKGIDPICAQQLTGRLIITKNGKPTLESKVDYKVRMRQINPTQAHSPDEADTCCLAVQAAKIRLGFGSTQIAKEAPKLDSYTQKMIAYEEQRKKQIGVVNIINSDFTSRAPFSSARLSR